MRKLENGFRSDVERASFGMGILVGMSVLSAIVGIVALAIQLSM